MSRLTWLCAVQKGNDVVPGTRFSFVALLTQEDILLQQSDGHSTNEALQELRSQEKRFRKLQFFRPLTAGKHSFSGNVVTACPAAPASCRGRERLRSDRSRVCSFRSGMRIALGCSVS